MQTILLVVFTAIIGGILIKREGIKALNSLKYSRINEPNNIIKAIGDGLFIFVSGVLLLTPGFATDILGFLIILPLTRKLIFGKISKNFKNKNSEKKHFIDGEFEDIEDDDDRKI